MATCPNLAEICKRSVEKETVAFALMCALVALAAPAYANSPAKVPPEEVRDINNRAVRALVEEDYSRAIALFEESLVLEEFNITYLNLGRAYQLAGKCARAKAAYDEVAQATPIQTPRQAVVDEKASRYLSELRDSCTEEQLVGRRPVTIGQPTQQSASASESKIGC